MPLFELDRSSSGRIRVFVRAQLPFAIGAVVVFAALAFGAPSSLSSPFVGAAGILVVLATVAGALVPWERYSSWWLIALPVIDIVAVALLRTEVVWLLPGVSMLAIFPVLWIAYGFPPVAFAAAVGGTVLMTSLPFVIRGSWPATPLEWANVFTLPALILAVAVVVNIAAQHLRRNSLRLRAVHEERARALAQAHDNELVLRTVLDTVRSGVALYDDAGRLVLANRTAEDLARTMGAPLSDGVGDAMGWVGPPAAQRAILTDSDRVHRADGTLLGTVVVAHDVTEMANAAQLRHDFLRTVSHELRTPLTSVTGYLDLLTEHVQPDDPAAKRYLGLLERNVLVLTDRINELLAAASTDTEVSPRAVLLSDLIASAVRAVSPRAERRGSSIQQIGATDERVVLDPVRIRQCLEELLVNAVKFSPPASAVVIGQRLDEAGVHIVVSDSGPGLTSLERAHVFDPFYRTAYARENAIQGFGIGLSVVRNAVVAHGGRVRVGASASGGTAMAIVLPLSSPGAIPAPAEEWANR